MKIVITGSLGNVAKPLTEQLAANGHQITVISSNEAKKQDIESLGATAAIGSITDADFLTKTFEGADAVFVMTPPAISATNIVQNTINAGKNYAEALKKTGVKRAVMLSSVGAGSPVENGPIKGLHAIENLYKDVENTSFTFLRAGYFYNNFFNDIPLIQNVGIIGGNYPEGSSIPLVHPHDIAKAAAEELVANESGKNIKYIVSDIRNAADFAKVLGAAVNKPELPWVEFSDEEALNGMLQAGLPQDMAELYVEMGRGMRTGVVQKDFIDHGSPVAGSVTLEEFAKEFSSKF
ncbi:NAD-dependent epimerase/dehydratase family protein [Chryseobacterium indologenes]|uniref:NAD-dependent epimerase/dehydratase family protein n=1 Tax=Chryseobacterium indologenes TaxID=253 RepID=A0AAD0YW17_CHRID|nr:NAD(P)H-binding protein [Chryseobacterium indologenes]AZB18488.1 NAD-dependent epimerase/dehydratase family protein [Chryseobacterium indologenes]